MLLGISTLLWVQRSLVPVGVVVKLGGVAAVLAPVRDLVLQAAETAGELVPVGHNATNSGGQGQGRPFWKAQKTDSGGILCSSGGMALETS